MIDIFERYLSQEIRVKHALAMLGVKRTRFFDLLKIYREKPENFSLDYKRNNATRKIEPEVEKRIVTELDQEKKLIQDQPIIT